MHQQQQQQLLQEMEAQGAEAGPSQGTEAQGAVPESEDAPGGHPPGHAAFNPAAYLQIWNTMQASWGASAEGGAAGGGAAEGGAASTPLAGEGPSGQQSMEGGAGQASMPDVAQWCAALPSGVRPAPLHPPWSRVEGKS